MLLKYHRPTDKESAAVLKSPHGIQLGYQRSDSSPLELWQQSSDAEWTLKKAGHGCASTNGVTEAMPRRQVPMLVKQKRTREMEITEAPRWKSMHAKAQRTRRFIAPVPRRHARVDATFRLVAPRRGLVTRCKPSNVMPRYVRMG